MRSLNREKILTLKNTICLLIYLSLVSGCSFVYPERNQYSKTKPFLFETSIELKGNFTKDERQAIITRLYTQLDDSAKVKQANKFFIFHPVLKPPVYDSAYSIKSAQNMKGLLRHLGYYNAKDTILTSINRTKPTKQKVTVKYIITPGNPTLVDSFSYKLKNPELQKLAVNTSSSSFIEKGSPVTRTAVLSEISRLVDLYRNNGYFKLTSDELRMRGDSTIAALTNVSDDPFENIRLLAEAAAKRNRPTVKLALVQNPASESSRLKKYYINNVYVYPDFSAGDIAGVAQLNTVTEKGITIRYHRDIIRADFLVKRIFLKTGDLYRQEDFNKTINSFSRTGVWQNVNVQAVELKDSTTITDSTAKIDLVIQLVPSAKYGFETNIEASYSASNTNSINVANAGNLLGLSGNISLQNRNTWRRGIKMTHSFRAGLELNLNAKVNANNFINSSELSYNNTISIPKLPSFVYELFKTSNNKLASQQTFFNSSISNTNRIGLFKLNSIGFATGIEFSPTLPPGRNLTLNLKILNVEYSNLYNRSRIFDSTLEKNPYLRYSFNTALVLGTTIGLNYTTLRPGYPQRSTILKANLEESGFLFVFLPLKDVGFLKKDLKQFFKLDVEATHNIAWKKSSVALRVFAGVGIPLGDQTLPFFKQYFAGGPNSMRGWPVRGIGPGSKALQPYTPNFNALNDRTGDIRFETNVEYRKDLFQIIPNTLMLKWALFADIGNVWNFKNNALIAGGIDSTQFQLKNFYKQLGVNLGTGLRFDFNYVMLRFDFGFRFKRPELEANDGWKVPSIGFDDLFKKIFSRGVDDEYRRWRYENFNFSIGLTYPF